ncbi:MAG: glycine betaine/L-proline ABC transporter ATP-binding protein ProV [Desulfobacterales bacterium]|nr:glycine betaine/L-proline ABC transporter ATP-binding protein ProV [Desulfobacterales bacterium]MCF8079603.1 glycine betaine/L-proline ABC transporter ATP-binding protein ProV [Desulfobacterales bacterium]
MTEKVVVKDLFKIFGHDPKSGLKLIEEGLDKEQIFEKTGLTVGVREASFTVNAGEIFVVMGLSGSGKSTLVRMLNRLIEPTAGEVFLDGENITKMNRKSLIDMRRHKMSMVFQSFALMPHLTVLQNASFGLDISGLGKQEREERAMNALDQVGLKPYADSLPQELSGGMQQRVGLARALAQDPDILLMDEAFSALDPLIRSEMQDELLKLQEISERTVIFISHDLHEAMRIGDRIAMMEGGRIVQVGTPDEILKNPADKYVKSFFRGVDPTTVFSAKDVARKSQLTLRWHKGEGAPRAALEQLREEDREFGYVIDKQRKFMGVVSTDSLESAMARDENTLDAALLDNVEPVPAETPLQEILAVVRRYEFPVPVVDEDNVYLGVISKNAFLRTLEAGVPETGAGTA